MERWGGADNYVRLQKQAVQTVIKLTYLSKCQEELGATGYQ